MKMIANCLRKLPISSKWIGPVKKIMGFNDLKKQDQLKIIHDSLPFELANRKYIVKALTIAKLSNARIYRSCGFVITEEDALYSDNASHWDYPSIHHVNVLRKIFMPRIQRTYKETVAVVSSHGSKCYFHWMIEIVPKIILLKEMGLHYDLIYLPPITREFQKETLKQLGVEKYQWIEASDRTMIEVKEALVPSRPDDCGWARQCVTPWIIEKLNALYPDQGEEPTRNLYISRNKSTRRRITNEEALLGVLEGFETIYLEDYSVAEQASLFRSAKIIVTPHGAGLTNLVFARKALILIELFHPNYIVYCYHDMADLMGLAYTALFMTPEGTDSSVDIDAFKRSYETICCHC